MDMDLDIVMLYSKEVFRELTIRQISKLIGKSYAYTNKEAWKLIDKGVLKKKEIGKAIVCSLDIKNRLSFELMAYGCFFLGIGNKRDNDDEMYDQEISDKEISDKVMHDKVRGDDVLFAFIYDHDVIKVKISQAKVKDDTVIEISKFRELLSSKFLDDKGFRMVPVYGYEKFWEVVFDEMSK